MTFCKAIKISRKYMLALDVGAYPLAGVKPILASNLIVLPTETLPTVR